MHWLHARMLSLLLYRGCCVHTARPAAVQLVLLLDATDAMTSQTIEARKAYQASDIVLVSDESDLLIHRQPDGSLVVDYTCFCARTQGELTVENAVAEIADADAASTPSLSPMSAPGGGPPRSGGGGSPTPTPQFPDDAAVPAPRQEAGGGRASRLPGEGTARSTAAFTSAFGGAGCSAAGPGSSEALPRYGRSQTGETLAATAAHAAVQSAHGSAPSGKCV
jgi:hypothetical protein